MICELCGKRTNRLFTVVIEGAKMQVCEECARFGKEIHEIKSFPTEVREIQREEEELIEDWREKIKEKIMEESRMGKSVEEIAKEWKVKESLLKGILSGNIEIGTDLAKRFEKIIGVSLIKKIKVCVKGEKKKKGEEPRITLGDIVKIRVKS